MSSAAQTRVGVGVFVQNGNKKFILGRRKGSHGAGTWALPGGHLEFGESFEDCARREVLEETGLEVQNLHFLTATNDVMIDEGKHYVTVFMVCEAVGEVAPRVMEPEKCECWEWTSVEELRSWAKGEGSEERKLFLPLTNLLRQQPFVELQSSP